MATGIKVFTVKIFGKNYPFIPLIATFLCAITLFMLGNWQIKRLNDKEELISAIDQSLDNKAIIPDSLKNIDSLPLFSKIKLQGKFLADIIYLYGKRSGSMEKDGYYILTPFSLKNSDQVMLVARGWAPQSVKTMLDEGQIILPTGYEEIESIIMPSEQKLLLTPENDLNRHIWFNIDAELASRTHGITYKKIYLRQIDANNLPTGIKPLNTRSLRFVRNDHLEYAITWYCLSVASIIMFFVYFNKTE